MKFIDFVKINIKSGDGGPGHISFRTEKFAPKGGPDGGTGGKGGDVILQTDYHLNTLLDFKYRRKYEAQDGIPGMKKKMTGKNGKDLIIKVPCGTLVKSVETDEVIADLTENNKELIIAKGGKGGKGNAEFATATNQTPRYAQDGIPGIEKDIVLELKLIADVGIVGYPNVGKSTLISVISDAKPKIADYHFTTLVPNLGIVRVGEYQNYTVADIPGLIQDAHKGKGLGFQFLRHVERTRVLLFMLEAISDDPKKDYEVLLNELVKYNPDMKYKQKVICFSKSDMIDDERRKELSEISFEKEDYKPMFISSIIMENIDKIKWTLWNIIQEEIEE